MTRECALMPVCRTCGAMLDREARFCRRCGNPVDRISTPVQPALSLHLPASNLGELRIRLLSIAPLTGLVIFALYVLGQSAIQTEVRTFYLDDTYHKLILTELRVNSTAYYSIAVRLFHQLYGPGTSLGRFPLIFYLWLLVPTVGDIKWLYLLFAMAGSIASYFAVATVTKQRVLAALSAAWIAYFLQTDVYLMFEYWAVTVFLIGLAFFVSERHILAAVTIGVATLIKEVFAPFMLVASVCYVSQSILRAVIKKNVWEFLASPFSTRFNVSFFGRNREPRMRMLLAWVLSNKKATVWSAATFVVGTAYYLNGLASNGSLESPINFFRTFDPSILSLLFAGSWFRNPPLPLIMAVGLALIGMGVLASWDQRIIAYASFAFMILLMLTAQGAGLHSEWKEVAQSCPRFVSMSITLVNLFWLVGLYKILEYPVRRISSLRTDQRIDR